MPCNKLTFETIWKGEEMAAFMAYMSQLLGVGFCGPKIVASSCTYLGLAQVIIVLIIDILDYLFRLHIVPPPVVFRVLP